MEILKLNPVFKDYIWGGNRLKNDFGFETGFDKTAEGWMLACHKDGMNTVCGGEFGGKTLQEVFDSEGLEKVAGKNCLKFPYFPVLIKIIDAFDNLSVQVHPDDEYARRVENEFGKTEIWYVLDALDGAELIYGFKENITSDEFKEAIENNTLLDKLNRVKVNKGDLFFIEAGTVHAIGKGALIAEIQQNSNCTYRVYDYGRVGKDGKPRELHIQKAIDVSKTEPPKYDIKPQGEEIKTACGVSQLLSKCDLFTVNRYKTDGKITLETNEKSFNHILVIDGEGEIEGRKMKKGDSFFVPANNGEYSISGKIEFLVTEI
ncbi:MAG: class I mannose-6-phosphate isomerase [Eubacterium sp.]|nr:class I mannose-6-phosphate isomerase [Eubacterium sp.]